MYVDWMFYYNFFVIQIYYCNFVRKIINITGVSKK